MREPVAARPGPKLEAELAGLLDEKLAGKVNRTVEEHRALAERDAANLEQLRKSIGRKPMITVPELPGDVHDLDGLRAMNEHLFA
jgi:hypothetical protein